jgi:hypothetical protein
MVTHFHDPPVDLRQELSQNRSELLKVTARFSQTFSDFARGFFAALLSFPPGYFQKSIWLFLSQEGVHQRPVFEMDSPMNSAPSFHIEPSERLAEIGGLLAAALIRLQTRKSSRFHTNFGESSLHFSLGQSGDAPTCSPEASP